MLTYGKCSLLLVWRPETRGGWHGFRCGQHLFNNLLAHGLLLGSMCFQLSSQAVETDGAYINQLLGIFFQMHD